MSSARLYLLYLFFSLLYASNIPILSRYLLYMPCTAHCLLRSYAQFRLVWGTVSIGVDVVFVFLLYLQ